MATSTIKAGLLFLFKIKSSATSGTIANNSGTTLAITADAVDGYTPIAVTEVTTSHSLAWQIGGLSVNPSTGEISLYVSNHSGQSQTISAAFRILYVRSDLIKL